MGWGAPAAPRRAAPWSGVLCLNYHRIGSGASSAFDRGLWSTDEDGFDAHVRFLCSHFDVVAPPDLDLILKRRRGRHVLITFDDGYRDNYTAALPILKRHGARATFFVATGFIDRPSTPVVGRDRLDGALVHKGRPPGRPLAGGARVVR